MSNAFDQMHPNDQRKLVDGLTDYVNDGAERRRIAADQRHAELVGRLDLLFAALAAGMRAAADVLDRGPRR